MEDTDNNASHLDPLHDNKNLSNSQAGRLAFSEALSSEPPCCPECYKAASDRNLEKCQYCGFHYGYLEKLFPKELPTLGRLNDLSNTLSKSEKKSLEKILKKIKKKYPQVFVKLVILPLQSDIQIQQMALWMFNQCPLPAKEKETDRLWTILLMIDTTSKSSCYTNGYKIEVFWTHNTSSDSITSINSDLRIKTLHEALERSLEAMIINLDHSKKMVKKLYRKFKKGKH